MTDKSPKDEPLTQEDSISPSDYLSKPPSQIGLTKYRYVIVIIFCLVNFSNAIHWVTFASCAEKFSQLYNLNKFQVDLFSMIFMIIYPFVYLPESYIIDKISTRLGLSIAAALTIGGAALKVFLNKNVWFAYVGNFLVASFQPAILNSPAKIASTWFDEKSRVLITSICCASNTIGVLFGFLIHGFVFDDDEMNKENFQLYLIVELIITAALCTPMLILMRSKPKIPPTKSQQELNSPPLKESLCLLLKNGNFNKLLISTTCIIGFVNIFGTIVNSFLSKYHLSDEGITYIAATANLSGIVASLLVSIIVDKSKKYKKVLIVLNITGVLVMAVGTTLLEVLSERYALIVAFVLYTITVSSIIPIYTTAMDYVCELTYPVGESISEGLIMSSNQISGIAGIVLCDCFMEYWPQWRYLTNVFFIGLFVISFISIMTIKEKLVRLEKDEEKKEDTKEDV